MNFKKKMQKKYYQEVEIDNSKVKNGMVFVPRKKISYFFNFKIAFIFIALILIAVIVPIAMQGKSSNSSEIDDIHESLFDPSNEICEEPSSIPGEADGNLQDEKLNYIVSNFLLFLNDNDETVEDSSSIISEYQYIDNNNAPPTFIYLGQVKNNDVDYNVFEYLNVYYITFNGKTYRFEFTNNDFS